MKIITSKVKQREYLYLEHSYRDNSKKIIKKRLYLGKTMPNNIEEIKKQFLDEIDGDKWYISLDSIKKNFNKEFLKLPLTAKEKYNENFLIKFTYNSNKIEGSTITLRETANILKLEQTPANKPIKDIKEVESHKLVFDEMCGEKEDLSLNLVLKWHKLLLENIDEEIAGKIRNHDVGIAGSKFEPPSPDELNYQLRKFFQWYKNCTQKHAHSSIHPVKLAALVHLKFVTIHPFTDGNGRISRILMNFILKKHKFPMLDITYSGRSNYYTALERSQTTSDDRIFLKHIINRYLKDYQKYIK